MPYIVVVSGENSQGGSVSLSFQSNCSGRRRARRYARLLARMFDSAELSIVGEHGAVSHEIGRS